MSETGFTSLILAAAGGHVEVVKTLVEKVMNAMDTVRRSHDQFLERRVFIDGRCGRMDNNYSSTRV